MGDDLWTGSIIMRSPRGEMENVAIDLRRQFCNPEPLLQNLRSCSVMGIAFPLMYSLFFLKK